MNRKTTQLGFTLTELAVVVLIVALVVGGMLLPLGTQDEIRRAQETDAALREIHDALLGFAVTNGRLPCPDTDLDGAENCTTTVAANSPVAGQTTTTFACTAPCEGGLPFATLATTNADSWNNRFRYVVTPSFTQSSRVTDDATGNVVSSTPGFALGAAGAINVETRGDNPATPGVESKFILPLAVTVPSVVISHGPNGLGAITSHGTAMAAPPAASADETANATTGTPKRWRVPTADAAPCSDTAAAVPFCGFDDQLIWVSPNILFNRMIAAGRLP